MLRGKHRALPTGQRNYSKIVWALMPLHSLELIWGCLEGEKQGHHGHDPIRRSFYHGRTNHHHRHHRRSPAI